KQNNFENKLFDWDKGHNDTDKPTLNDEEVLENLEKKPQPNEEKVSANLNTEDKTQPVKI
ncbi:hypothetical protein MKX03_017188, partial [Papaver bracteatum]